MSEENRKLKDIIQRLQQKLDKALESSSTCLDDETSKDFQDIMDEQNNNIEAKFPEDSFQAVFWKHQRELLTMKGKQKMGTDGIHG